MNLRHWVTLAMRVFGLGLVLFAAPSFFGLFHKHVLQLLTVLNPPFEGPILRVWGFNFMEYFEYGRLPQLALGLYMLLGGKWLLKILFRGLGSTDGLCPHCGYDVRGITSRRCPECGKLIRPGAD